MDLKQVILHEHSSVQALKIIRFVNTDPRNFKQLVQVFLDGPYRVTQRAASPLSTIAQRHPELMAPHLNNVLSHLKKTNVDIAVKRNILRLLQFVDIPKRMHGQVADRCFAFLRDLKEPVAVRVCSMTILAGISQHSPELMQELRIIIEDHLPYASPAFVSRARKVLKVL